MKLLLLIFCLTISSCLSDDNICPSSEDIKPCSCSIGVDNRPSISCEGLESVDDLKKAMKGMQDFKFSNFYIEKSNIGILPSDIFSDIEVRFMNILFTNLTSLSESLNMPAFLGLESTLEYLQIRDAFITEETPLIRISLSHLKKLQYLQLEGNVIPTIGNDWFESGPYRLKQLYLMDTYTKKVGSHAFSSLSELRRFSLTGGSVSEIVRDMFPSQATYLETLDFSNNKISVLPKDIFSRMPSLNEVF
ncbi:uncharacterized protein CDAR_267901 [Caerostris darwini]|uniref:Uncharacterized protein n=1 Tax=Caerostris darwini TaxID=1538125 RepID=A0AAV4UGJ1_9ARAC|nr:uncharacterized protein CDAR_267901 [Caerostris darwini]